MLVFLFNVIKYIFYSGEVHNISSLGDEVFQAFGGAGMRRRNAGWEVARMSCLVWGERGRKLAFLYRIPDALYILF